ncbi:MAG: hypothetical protein ACM4AI_03560 [Acidobacteriota bacterium]
MSRASRQIGDLVIAVQDCFLAAPGQALTPWQVERLSGADETTCRAILDLLADGGVIARTSGGRYIRNVSPSRLWTDGRRRSGSFERLGITRIAFAG